MSLFKSDQDYAARRAAIDRLVKEGYPVTEAARLVDAKAAKPVASKKQKNPG